MSRLLNILIGGLVLTLLAACGGGSSGAASGADAVTSVSGQAELDQLVTRAQDEGELTIYTVASEEPIRAWAGGFEEKYGIDVSIYRASQAVLWERFAQETQVGQHLADYLIMNNPRRLVEADGQGWVAQFTPTGDERYPDEAKQPGKWYLLYRTVEPLAWNTNKVTPAEAETLRTQGLRALTDSRWKGRVAVVAPHATERVLATYYRWIVEQDSELGWPYVEKLATLEPAIYESAAPLVERLVAGEHAVVLGSASSIAGRAVSDGAPIEFIYPETATAASFFGAATTNAPHPNAARLFQQWAATPEALTALSKFSEGEPPYEDVPDQRTVVDEEWYTPPQNIDNDWETDEQMADMSKEILDRWAEAFGYGR